MILDLYGLSVQTLLLRSAFSVPKLRKYCTTNIKNESGRRPLALLRRIFRKGKSMEKDTQGDMSVKTNSDGFFMQDENAQFTHRIEITRLHGYNFPSVYTAGKPQCYLVASLTGGVNSAQKSSIAVGDNPAWSDTIVFDVPSGYLHRILNLKLFYKPKIFGSDAEMGSLSHPLLSVDECKEEDDVSSLSTITAAFEPNFAIKNLDKRCEQIKEENREPLSLEFSMKVLRIAS